MSRVLAPLREKQLPRSHSRSGVNDDNARSVASVAVGSGFESGRESAAAAQLRCHNLLAVTQSDVRGR